MVKNNTAVSLLVRTTALLAIVWPHSHGFAATAAGQFGGQAGVSRSGSFTYQLPIQVPAGIDGLQPDLSINYDSQSGNGLLGKSFSLGGLSSIQRCGQIKRIDGDTRPVALNAADRFCWDGSRLVLDGTAKAYGADQAVYRTEFDQFAKIVSAGAVASPGSGPTQFTVRTKKGLILQYGVTDDSRLLLGKPNSTDAAPTSVVSWSLNKTSDLIGNTIDYVYSVNRTDGSQYISKITYNRGRAYLTFEYEDDSMPATRFLGGGKASQTKLLKKITVYVKTAGDVEQLVRSYQFAYKYGDLKGGKAEGAVAMLDTVTHCGTTASNCLAPLTFNWVSAPATSGGFQPSSRILTTNQFTKSADLYSDVKNPRRFADFNSDGVLDIVGFVPADGDFSPSGVYVALSDEGKVGAYPSEATLALADFVSGDFGPWDNNGLFERNPRHVIDMNRDGYPDIVGFSTSFSSSQKGVYVSLWNPSSKTFGAKIKQINASRFVDRSSGDKWGPRGDSCSGLEDFAPRFIVDMNKDGYPDIVGLDGDGVYVSYWDGSSMSTATKVAASPAMDSWNSDCAGQAGIPIYVEDMNADGFPDLLGVGYEGVQLWLWDPSSENFSNKGVIFRGLKGGHPQDEDKPFPTIPTDMNGDGLPDLVQFASDGVRIALWNGATFNPSSIWTDEFKNTDRTNLAKSPWRLADMNGDGFPDLVAFGSTGVKVAMSNGATGFVAATTWSEDEFKTGKDATGNTWELDMKTPRHLVDLDGDGQTDIFGFGSLHVRWARQLTAPGVRLISVVDSLGAQTKVEYTVTQAYSGFYQDDATRSVWPKRDGHGPTHVVSRISRDNGLGAFRDTAYRYEGRKSDYFDGGLGFARIYERDALSGIERLTTLNQAVPLIGAVKSEESYKSTVSKDDVVKGCVNVGDLCMRDRVVVKGQTLSKRSIIYHQENLAAAGESPVNYQRRFIAPETTTVDAWELDGTALPRSTTLDEYEESTQWGNLTKRTVTTSKSGASSFVTTTQNEYHPADVTNWKLGRVKKQTVTATRPAVTVTTETPTEMALTPDKAGPKPISPAVLSVIMNLLLQDD